MYFCSFPNVKLLNNLDGTQTKTDNSISTKLLTNSFTTAVPKLVPDLDVIKSDAINDLATSSSDIKSSTTPKEGEISLSYTTNGSEEEKLPVTIDVPIDVTETTFFTKVPILNNKKSNDDTKFYSLNSSLNTKKIETLETSASVINTKKYEEKLSFTTTNLNLNENISANFTENILSSNTNVLTTSQNPTDRNTHLPPTLMTLTKSLEATSSTYAPFNFESGMITMKTEIKNTLQEDQWLEEVRKQSVVSTTSNSSSLDTATGEGFIMVNQKSDISKIMDDTVSNKNEEIPTETEIPEFITTSSFNSSSLVNIEKETVPVAIDIDLKTQSEKLTTIIQSTTSDVPLKEIFVDKDSEISVSSNITDKNGLSMDTITVSNNNSLSSSSEISIDGIVTENIPLPNDENLSFKNKQISVASNESSTSIVSYSAMPDDKNIKNSDLLSTTTSGVNKSISSEFPFISISNDERINLTSSLSTTTSMLSDENILPSIISSTSDSVSSTILDSSGFLNISTEAVVTTVSSLESASIHESSTIIVSKNTSTLNNKNDEIITTATTASSDLSSFSIIDKSDENTTVISSTFSSTTDIMDDTISVTNLQSTSHSTVTLSSSEENISPTLESSVAEKNIVSTTSIISDTSDDKGLPIETSSTITFNTSEEIISSTELSSNIFVSASTKKNETPVSTTTFKLTDKNVVETNLEASSVSAIEESSPGIDNKLYTSSPQTTKVSLSTTEMKPVKDVSDSVTSYIETSTFVAEPSTINTDNIITITSLSSESNNLNLSDKNMIPPEINTSIMTEGSETFTMSTAGHVITTTPSIPSKMMPETVADEVYETTISMEFTTIPFPSNIPKLESTSVAKNITIDVTTKKSISNETLKTATESQIIMETSEIFTTEITVKEKDTTMKTETTLAYDEKKSNATIEESRQMDEVEDKNPTTSFIDNQFTEKSTAVERTMLMSTTEASVKKENITEVPIVTTVTSASKIMNKTAKVMDTTTSTTEMVSKVTNASHPTIMSGVGMDCLATSQELLVKNSRNKTIVLITGTKRKKPKITNNRRDPNVTKTALTSSCLRNADCSSEEICFNNLCTLKKDARLWKSELSSTKATDFSRGTVYPLNFVLYSIICNFFSFKVSSNVVISRFDVEKLLCF